MLIKELMTLKEGTEALNMPGSYVLLTNMADFESHIYQDPETVFGDKIKSVNIPMDTLNAVKDQLLKMGVTEEEFEFQSESLDSTGNTGGSEHIHMYDVTKMSTEDMRKFAANFTRGRIGEHGESNDPDNWASSYIRIKGGLTVRKLASLIKMLERGEGGTIGK